MDELFYLHIARFLSKVKTSSKGCWNWNGSKNQAGYGQFVINNRKFSAHRLSYQFFKGEIKDLNVLHQCDNKLCVNPLHLFLGIQSDNMLDREAKGRANKHTGKRACY